MSSLIEARIASIAWKSLNYLVEKGLQVFSGQVLSARAREKLMDECLRKKLVSAGAMSSAGLHSSTQTKALLETVMQPEFEPLRVLAQQRLAHQAERIPEAQCLLPLLQQGSAAPLDHFSASAGKCLESALAQAHHELKAAERGALLRGLESSLSQLNYETKSRVTSRGTILQGRQGDRAVFAMVSPDGELMFDFAGFVHDDCHKAFGELTTALRFHGIELAVQKESFHGRKEGGALARSADEVQAVVFNPLRARLPKRASRLSKALGQSL